MGFFLCLGFRPVSKHRESVVEEPLVKDDAQAIDHKKSSVRQQIHRIFTGDDPEGLVYRAGGL